MATPKDVERAIIRFRHDEITWDEVLKIGTGVKYGRFKKSGAAGWFDVSYETRTFDQATMLAETSKKVTREMINQLKAVAVFDASDD